MVGVNLEEIDAREVNSIRLFDDAEGREVHVRVGRFGPYLERMVQNPDDPEGDLISQRANLPDDLPPDELTPEYAEKLFSTPQEGRKLGVDPLTGHEIVAKEGRFGPYVTEILPEPPAEPEPDIVPVTAPEPEEISSGSTKTAVKKAAAKKRLRRRLPRRSQAPSRGPDRCSSPWIWRRSPWKMRCVCCRFRASWVSTPNRRKRSPRRTAVTVRT